MALRVANVVIVSQKGRGGEAPLLGWKVHGNASRVVVQAR
jgi:hypothetical protein